MNTPKNCHLHLKKENKLISLIIIARCLFQMYFTYIKHKVFILILKFLHHLNYKKQKVSKLSKYVRINMNSLSCENLFINYFKNTHILNINLLTTKWFYSDWFSLTFFLNLKGYKVSFQSCIIYFWYNQHHFHKDFECIKEIVTNIVFNHYWF